METRTRTTGIDAGAPGRGPVLVGSPPAALLDEIDARGQRREAAAADAAQIDDGDSEGGHAG